MTLIGGGRTHTKGQQDSALGGALRPPKFPPDAISRPRVVARIDAATRGALTLLIAPAGWGKSLAATEWAQGHHDDVAWVEFDQGLDRNGAAALLMGAVRSLGATTHTAASEPVPVLDAPLRAFLIERLLAVPDSYVVLDGLDRLAPDLRGEIGLLVEQAPAHVHFVATARADVLFPATIARLRVRDDVAYVRTAELAFDRVDTRTLLQHTLDTPVASEDIETLLVTTEGWPVALQFAAVALSAAVDVHAAARVFGASNLNVRDYCRTETLAGLPRDVQTFALQTSVPDRVTTSLCRALTGREDTPAVLDLIERHGLLERGGTDPEWRRYRPLLRDALRAELRAADPTAEARLLDIAAAWHIDRDGADDFAAAGRYLVRAEHWDAVCQLAHSYTRTLQARGRAPLAMSWLAAVPEPIRRAKPDTTILEAALHLLAGETMLAETVLRALDHSGLTSGQQAAVATIRAIFVQGHVSPARALDAADDALRLLDGLPLDDFVTIAGLVTPRSNATIAKVTRARANWYLGDVVSAREELETEIETGDTLPLSRVHVFGALAEIEACTGSLEQAKQYASYARLIAMHSLAADHPYLVAAELAHAHVLIERGAYIQAELVLDRADYIGRSLHFEVWRDVARLERAWLALATGNPRRGLELLDTARPVSAARPYLDARRQAVRARLLLALDDVTGARAQLERDDTAGFSETAAAAIQVALVEGDLRLARHLVHTWPPRTTMQGHLAYRYWSAVVDFVDGNANAVDASADIVTAVEAERHVRLLLDGFPVARGFLVALARRDAGGYVGSVLRAEQPTPAEEGGPSARQVLSLREREVLRLLASRLTYAEISERLFISHNTVKSHAKGAYMKLDARNRAEAVRRAEDLGLI